MVLYPALQTSKYTTKRPVVRVAVGARGSVVQRSATSITTAPTTLHSQPLMRVLNDADGFACFLAFTRSEFNSENVLFIQAVKEYRCSPPHTVDNALRIYHTFISHIAQLQVNLSHTVVREIQSVLGPYLSPASQLPVSPPPCNAAAPTTKSTIEMGASPPSVSVGRRLPPIERKADVTGPEAIPTPTGVVRLDLH
jgi:hypothetical protein